MRSLPELDTLPAQAVLLIPHRRQQLPQPRIAELLKWVDNGGHLIVEAESLGVADPLLDQLGVRRSRSGEATPKPFVLELPESDRKLTVYFQNAMKLEPPRGRGSTARRLEPGLLRARPRPGHGGLDAALRAQSLVRRPFLQDGEAARGVDRRAATTPSSSGACCR